MDQELGKIEKPDAESFKKGRRLFLVPLLYAGKDAPPDYVEKYELYWKQVDEQVRHLESRVGLVNRVYHESISVGGKEGLEIMEKVNIKSYEMARQKCQDKAQLEVIEDKQLAEENMDWERCMLIGFLSDTVASKVYESYVESAKKRYAYMGKKIDETLEANEIAILFIREGHMVQFPKDVEVFSVAPPSLDEIHRWMRDRINREKANDQV